MKIGVIILNYLAYNDTINCVNDFLCQNIENDDEVRIVIVDNCSFNESFEILYNYFIDNDLVKVIKTTSNIGFAKGNNFGYNYLINNFGRFDFIIIANDDILIKSNNLYSWIKSNYTENEFAILGPKIFSTNGNFYQSPMKNFDFTLFSLRKKIFMYRFKLFVLHILGNTKLFKNEVVWDNHYYDRFTTDMTLHGSFLVFSEKYFSFFKTPFDDRTNFYLEEDILRYRCNVSNIKMVYSPFFEVHHLQAVSTNIVNKSTKKKHIFRTKNIILSLKVLIDYVKKTKKR